jgi:hypothetical protein
MGLGAEAGVFQFLSGRMNGNREKLETASMKGMKEREKVKLFCLLLTTLCYYKEFEVCKKWGKGGHILKI